jgi:hypothetical protein
MLEQNVFKECKKCDQLKMLIDFIYQKDVCKECDKKRRSPTIRQILAKNEQLTCPGWYYRGRRRHV